MKRKIYLEGDIANKFGKELNADVSSVRDAFKLLSANYPEFKQYLIDSHENNVGFIIDIEGVSISEEDLIRPINTGDITILAVPAGSKSGGAKILAAIAIIAISIITGGAALAAAWAPGGAMSLQASLALSGILMGIQLAIVGLQQIMAPDPSVDEQSPQSYLFNGSEQNIIEGDPVPVLYGELRVPGRPIGFSVSNMGSTFSNNTSNGVGQETLSITMPFSGNIVIFTTSEPALS